MSVLFIWRCQAVKELQLERQGSTSTEIEITTREVRRIGENSQLGASCLLALQQGLSRPNPSRPSDSEV